MKFIYYLKTFLIMSIMGGCTNNAQIDVNPDNAVSAKTDQATAEEPNGIDAGNRNKTSKTANKNTLTIQDVLNPPVVVPPAGCSSLPVISEISISNIGPYSAVFTTRILNAGTNCSVTSASHDWGEGSNSSTKVLKTNDVLISTSVTLKPNTSYTIKASVANEFGAVSNSKTFTTSLLTTGTDPKTCDPAFPTTSGAVVFENPDLSTLFPNRAIFTGTIKDFGNNCPITEYGHILIPGTNSNFTIQSAGVVKRSSTGNYTGSLTYKSDFTGLSAGAAYSVRAFTTSATGTFHSAVYNFKTPSK
jgi:hypothetical protein